MNTWQGDQIVRAVAKGDLRDLRSLISKNVDVNAQAGNGWTALVFASWEGHTEIVEELLLNGADVNGRLGNIKASESDSVPWSRSIDWISHLTSGTALHIAALRGHTGIARLLLGKGAIVNVQTKLGKTPLHYAIERDHEEMASLLLDHGAEVNATRYLFHTLQHSGKTRIVELLLTRGADVNARNSEGFTALHLAVGSKNINTVKLLLDAGADVNAKDGSGNTPLDSVFFLYRKMRRLLQSYGGR